MKILADIGGTFARFAIASASGFEKLTTYRAADFSTLEEALSLYAAQNGLLEGAELLIATAAYEDGAVWRFVNDNRWVIDPGALEGNGWDLRLIINDFAACTWGLRALDPGNLEIVQAGRRDPLLPLCVAGPGTGLGLGFIFPAEGGTAYVQRTHGGHMPAAAITSEQTDIVRAIQASKTAGAPAAVYEDLVSGRGLVNLYRALRDSRDGPEDVLSPADLLTRADSAEMRQALRLFHEFFGLFCANAVITAHAYGGVYLTGGLLTRLAGCGLFDKESFLKFFALRVAESVCSALASTPVFRITHPVPALLGLLAAEKAQKNA